MLAVLPDFAEEGWPSMDLCAEQLIAGINSQLPGELRAERLCPPFRRRLTRIPGLGSSALAVNADRLLNRLRDFPRWAGQRRSDFDLFHICDHSYAQLVHRLPAERTGVYCHDLNTFRCLLEPEREPRPRWFRAMARRILRGLQKAAVVFHSTAAVRAEIERHGVCDASRLVHCPYGVAAEFTPAPTATKSPEIKDLLRGLGGRRVLLHVGSCVPRKRIDVLLDVVAAVRLRLPDVLLVKAGGTWTAELREQIERLGLHPSVIHLPNPSRPDLAALYQRVSLTLLPSDNEGFGLPVIEALACGCAVLASDLPTLREVGGDAVEYLPVGAMPEWEQRVTRALTQPDTLPAREARLAQARQFTWARHARIITDAYLRLLK
jgi:glycosyltransferase involved in cell wall biosynthesis